MSIGAVGVGGAGGVNVGGGGGVGYGVGESAGTGVFLLVGFGVSIDGAGVSVDAGEALVGVIPACTVGMPNQPTRLKTHTRTMHRARTAGIVRSQTRECIVDTPYCSMNRVLGREDSMLCLR